MTKEEMKKAVQFAIEKSKTGNKHDITSLVRKYLNENNIEYETFSYKDLEPYLTQ